MLYCEPEHQAVVTAALEARGLKRMDFRFEKDGARVLLNAGLRLPQENFTEIGARTMTHGGGP
jgi:hypothetical protein